MKHLEKKIKRLLTVAILLTVSNINPIFAQNDAKLVYYGSDSIGHNFDPMDSVEVSLLTCSPHEEIYSLYGHAAIRWHSGEQDIVFNWGMFSFNKPYFVLRFVFGLTDYELGAYPYDTFWPYYKKWGSSITEQVLNLTNDEKRQLQQALIENLKPENKVYRYNFFYDNCSTKPRDMIEGCINGKVIYNEREDFAPTFREMVRECNRYHSWSKFGNDMLLGVKADMKTSREEQEFLPHNLMYDVARAQIYENGTYRPLVKEERLLVPPGVHKWGFGLGIGPYEAFTLLLLLSLGIALYEWRKKEDCPLVGRTADDHTSTGWRGAHSDDILTASYHIAESEPATVQPTAAAVHSSHHQRQAQHLAQAATGHASTVCHWWHFPELCRGYVDCGIMFADTT